MGAFVAITRRHVPFCNKCITDGALLQVFHCRRCLSCLPTPGAQFVRPGQAIKVLEPIPDDENDRRGQHNLGEAQSEHE